MNKKTLFATTILLFAAFTLIPIFVYIDNFGSSFSAEQEHWGAFSDYLNVFISILNIVFLALLTYSIYRYQREDEQNKSIPILIFKVDNRRKWTVQNVGKGVALNILISSSKKQDSWDKPTKVYSIMEGAELKLPWISAALQLRADYFDMNKNTLSSICQNDDTEFVKNAKKELFDRFNGEYNRLEDMGVKYSCAVA